jgi:copper chaperone CopZ
MKKIITLISCIGFLLANETVTTFKVDGMMCGVSCPKAIKKSLNNVDGIKQCIVDFDSKTATITYEDEKIKKEKIATIISEKTYFKVSEKNNEKPWSFFKWLFGKS